jgi:hypothetical protein
MKISYLTQIDQGMRKARVDMRVHFRVKYDSDWFGGPNITKFALARQIYVRNSSECHKCQTNRPVADTART